jgi:hypothetical protein
MLSKFLELILVFTSISPIFVIFSISEILNRKFSISTVVWIVLFFISLFLFYLIKKFAEKEISPQTVKVTQIAPADKEVSAFLVAYILPFLNISNYSLTFEIAVVVILYLIVLTSSNYHFNPLQSLMGYQYYHVNITENEYSYSYFLMTKKTIKDCKNIKLVIQISDYMILEVEEK